MVVIGTSFLVGKMVSLSPIRNLLTFIELTNASLITVASLTSCMIFFFIFSLASKKPLDVNTFNFHHFI